MHPAMLLYCTQEVKLYSVELQHSWDLDRTLTTFLDKHSTPARLPLVLWNLVECYRQAYEFSYCALTHPGERDVEVLPDFWLVDALERSSLEPLDETNEEKLLAQEHLTGLSLLYDEQDPQVLWFSFVWCGEHYMEMLSFEDLRQGISTKWLRHRVCSGR